MMTVRRVLLFAVVCVVFSAPSNAASAKSSNERRLVALERLVRDDSPRVRLEALRALAKIRSAKSAELALTVLDKPMDPFLDYALWLTINDLADQWIAAVKSGEWEKSPDWSFWKAPLIQLTGKKMGIIGFMRGLANDVADDGITANAVLPGLTNTLAIVLNPKNKGAPRGGNRRSNDWKNRVTLPVQSYS